jgi:hypothetical protein
METILLRLQSCCDIEGKGTCKIFNPQQHACSKFYIFGVYFCLCIAKGCTYKYMLMQKYRITDFPQAQPQGYFFAVFKSSIRDGLINFQAQMKEQYGVNLQKQIP